MLAPTKSGVILESLDESKTKLVATNHHRVSLLHEISIYTTTKEGTVPLEEVLRKIKSEFDADLGVDSSSEGGELKAFLKSVLPEFDEERVYTSDIKKLVKWYELILKYAPELLEAEEVEKKSSEDKKDSDRDEKAT